MSDSILDKVLLSKEDQEKQEFHPMDLVNTVLKNLGSKEADVLRRRFGLTTTGKETLETIGAVYGVTRERIRQIENQSIQKIKSAPSFQPLMKPVEHLIVSLLNHHGGVATDELLFDLLMTQNENTPQNQLAVSFILGQLLNDKIEAISKSKNYRAGWRLKLATMEFVDQTIQELYELIQGMGIPQPFEDIYTHFQETSFYQTNAQRLNEDTVLAYLDLSAKLAKNPFDEYGLAEWGLVLPKRMNDRVYLVLKKEEKPMHFEEIAKRISKVFKRQAYPPTVHNELILNKEYVLVGRGIYALSEWGYKDGVVAHVIVDILRVAGKPLTRSEIVDKVLEQRIVKKNTIHLALTDKTVFQKTPDGKYSVLESNDSKLSHVSI